MDKKFTPAVLNNGLISLDGCFTTTEQIVRANKTGTLYTATATLESILNTLETGVGNAVTQNTLNTAVNTAVTNALSSANYLQSSNLKTLTINGGSPISLVKDGTNNTIAITTGGGSGSGSTTVDPIYTNGVKIAIINNSDIYVPRAGLNQNGVITSDEWKRTYDDPCIGYTNQGNLTSNEIDNAYISINAFGLTNNRCAFIESFTRNGARYVVVLQLMSMTSSTAGVFTVEGQIKYGTDNKFSIDTNLVCRKYLIKQTSGSQRTVKLLYSDDMFTYDSAANTLSINN